MSNEKAMVISLIVELIKKISLYKMNYFPEPYTFSKNKIKVELNFSNGVTKSVLKKATGVNTLKFAKEIDLARLNSDNRDLGTGS